MCDEKHERINDRFNRVECDTHANIDDIKAINQKITATLVFTVVSLATLVTAIILKLL